MRNFYEDDEEDDGEDYPGDLGEIERMFDMKDLFQGDNTVAVEYTTHINVNRMILEAALRLLEHSFWWRFRSHASRMRLLADTYNNIHKLLLADLTGEQAEESDNLLDDSEDETEDESEE